MVEERRKPYIWPTWVSGLIAGEKQCQWAAWFKAHFKYTKRHADDENQLSVWKAEHAVMLRDHAAKLKTDGYRVRLEDQNSFTYRGKVADVGAKPDIVATRDSSAVIVDCKSGKEREADVFQVGIYMLLAPEVDEQFFSGKGVAGAIVYRDRQRMITPSDLTRMRKGIIEQIQLTGGGIAPSVTPSYNECRFCDITGCKDRVETDGRAVKEGNLF